MPLAASPDGLFFLISALIVAGLIAGFLSGLLGIGGGGVLVPVLYEAFGFAGVSEDVRMHMAVGTALAVVAPTVLRSFMAHRARGAVDMSVVRRMGLWVAVGVVVGTLIAKSVSGEALRWVWVLFGALLALKMALGRDDWKLAEVLPGRPVLESVSATIGCLSTLMGIGGATFTVPFLTLHGTAILQAVATATGTGLIISLLGLVGYILAGWGVPDVPAYSLGFVSLGALLIAPISVFAAPFGVRLAHGISKRKLELAFSAFLFCVVGRFLVSLLA